MGSITGTLPQRIGIIGDVHTESALLQRGIALLLESGAKTILCVGDIADGPEEVDGMEECVRILAEHEITTVTGNHDRWLLEGNMRELKDAIEEYELERATVKYLQALPAQLGFETPLGNLLLCHGIGEDDMAMLRPHDQEATLATNAPLQDLLNARAFQFVVHGHTHQRMVRTVGDVTFINAGTLHRRYEPCVTLIDFEARSVAFHGLPKGGGVDLLEEVPLPV